MSFGCSYEFGVWNGVVLRVFGGLVLGFGCFECLCAVVLLLWFGYFEVLGLMFGLCLTRWVVCGCYVGWCFELVSLLTCLGWFGIGVVPFCLCVWLVWFGVSGFCWFCLIFLALTGWL